MSINFKASDLVNHNVLLAKSDAIGLSGVVLDWINSYLNDRIQQDRINEYLNNFGTGFRRDPGGSSSQHYYLYK